MSCAPQSLRTTVARMSLILVVLGGMVPAAFGQRNATVDLLDSPVKTFGRTARFLGLKPPRARLEKSIRFSSFKALRQQEDKAGFKERSDKSQRFFRAGKKDQWKEKLTPEQVQAIVDGHREQMSRFGYVPEGY